MSDAAGRRASTSPRQRLGPAPLRGGALIDQTGRHAQTASWTHTLERDAAPRPRAGQSLADRPAEQGRRRARSSARTNVHADTSLRDPVSADCSTMSVLQARPEHRKRPDALCSLPKNLHEVFARCSYPDDCGPPFLRASVVCGADHARWSIHGVLTPTGPCAERNSARGTAGNFQI